MLLAILADELALHEAYVSIPRHRGAGYLAAGPFAHSHEAIEVADQRWVACLALDGARKVEVQDAEGSGGTALDRVGRAKLLGGKYWHPHLGSQYGPRGHRAGGKERPARYCSIPEGGMTDLAVTIGCLPDNFDGPLEKSDGPPLVPT